MEYERVRLLEGVGEVEDESILGILFDSFFL